MRAIIKATEPVSLTQHRLTEHSTYENYNDKEGLRASLVSEQRGLCCYCLKRIPERAGMKIEHWHSQDGHHAEQLDYSNLLAACKGNEGQKRAYQHCDTRKGNADLSRNPADRGLNIEDLIRFQGDGHISSDNVVLDGDLNSLLNLNLSFLVNSRKAVLDSFLSGIRREKPSRTTLVRWLGEWNGEAPHTGELNPFCQVVVYWLRKRLSRP